MWEGNSGCIVVTFHLIFPNAGISTIPSFPLYAKQNSYLGGYKDSKRSDGDAEERKGGLTVC